LSQACCLHGFEDRVIFGGAGFVGLNLAEALAERGNEALLFDRAP
jgi:nucleoside-diphosphate-sugar epimerase